MTHEEKTALVSLFVTVIVFGYYGFRFAGLYADGYFAGEDAMVRTGWEILYLIGYGIIAQIVAQILFAILYAIATNERKPSFLIDERDKLISLKGVRWGYGATGAGLTLCFIALAMGWDPVIVFNMVVFSIAIGATLETLVRVVLYRIGA